MVDSSLFISFTPQLVLFIDLCAGFTNGQAMRNFLYFVLLVFLLCFHASHNTQQRRDFFWKTNKGGKILLARTSPWKVYD
jgi:hypothetical protein